MNKIIVTKNNLSKIHISQKSKIIIVGTSGSGKSTFAKQLSEIFNLKDIELDKLYWNKNWKPKCIEDFQTSVLNEILDESGYVMHGNYNKIKETTWANCETLIWLNFNRWIVMKRIIQRTIKRVLLKELLWNSNTEKFRQSFFSKESIIRYAWITYRIRKIQYTKLFKDNSDFKQLIRIDSPKKQKLLKNSLLTTAST